MIQTGIPKAMRNVLFAIHRLVWLADRVTSESGFVEQGSLDPLIEARSRSEDLIDMVLGPKTQPIHLANQRAS